MNNMDFYGIELDKGFTLRINGEMLDKIRMIAKRDMRSINTKMLLIFQEYIEKYEKKHGPLK